MTGTAPQPVQPIQPLPQPVPVAQSLPVAPTPPAPPPPLPPVSNPEPVAAAPMMRGMDPNAGRKTSIKGPLLLMIIVLIIFAGLGFLFYKLFFENQVNSALSCNYNGTTYKDQEAFLSADACNSCACTGGIISCIPVECAANQTPTPGASGVPGDFTSGQYKIYLYACNNNNPGADWTFEVDGVLAASTTSPDTTGGLQGKNCRLKTIRTDKTTMTIKVTRDEDGVIKTQEKEIDATSKPYVYFNYKDNEITIEDYDRELELVDAS